MSDDDNKDDKVVTFKPAPSELDKNMGKMMGLMDQLAAENQTKVQFLAEQFGLEGELDRKTRSVLHHIQFTISEFDPPPFLWVLSLGWLYRAYMFTQFQLPERWEMAAGELRQAWEEGDEWVSPPDELATRLGIRGLDHLELVAIVEGLSQFNPHRGSETDSAIYLMLVTAVCVACDLETHA